MALLPCLLLRCTNANPAPAHKEIEVQQKATVFVPDEADVPEAPKICKTIKQYEIDSDTYESLPWELSPHDYKKPRFEGEGQRRANQQNTRKLISLTVKELGGSKDLLRFLKLIAIRESSLIGTKIPFDSMGVVHRLSADEESSVRSWNNQKSKLESNPFIKDSSLWRTYGPYGMNSVYSIYSFDKNADPRLLADTVAATIAQVQKLHFVANKLGGEVTCPEWSGESRKQTGWDGSIWFRGVMNRDESGKVTKSKVFVPMNWFTLHRAVQSGKICPAWEGDTLSKFYRKAFRRRAKSMKLESLADVDRSKLGSPPEDNYTAWINVWKRAGVNISEVETRICEE